jgi:hypothetical protein
MDTSQPLDSSLVDQHLAFKQNAVRVLHEVGNDRGWCTDFDCILLEAGVPGRDRFHEDPYTDRPAPELVGEETAEEHETWKHEVARSLHAAARRHGINEPSVDEVMSQIGLPTRDAFYRTVDLQVQGTFSVSLGSREVPVDTDVIDSVRRLEIGDALYRSIHADSDDITWKVVVTE